MNILEAKNLSYNYANSKEKVLSSVNQGFEEGEFYAIIGKSGAGKSTFLSLLAGLDSPQDGEILFRGENIEKEGYSKHRRDKLSGGQQQRVAIARALVSEAPVILADEPTGNLDQASSKEIIDLFKRLAKERNKCVIVVTHSKDIADAADVVLEISNKKLKRK